MVFLEELDQLSLLVVMSGLCKASILLRGMFKFSGEQMQLLVAATFPQVFSSGSAHDYDLGFKRGLISKFSMITIIKPVL